ncbi:hypothetical protein GPJ56_004045 [Histomonas meleagridis]|uniref:uncharacterized protein n=1 Tax=Histomonas meleagridis TaxID=135588 RepID=UPI003559CF38|nr:hypothetical protein GPJ56_004045 [Histomonas meleagridis]KAH0800601.1 hypothetical protein GO595_006354 [Histomonas meleagridis]
MEEFNTVTDAISYAFKHEETSILSLDRIINVLSAPNLFLRHKSQTPVELSKVITRRKISSTLSSSDLFVRAGPPRTCLWALRPNNPLMLSNSAILNAIEEALIQNGPLNIQQIAELTELSGSNVSLFQTFLDAHPNEFTADENKVYWFANQPHPIQMNFDNINQALLYALSSFPNGASVEELHWYLCLCTVGGEKRIKRRCISRELSRRQDLFVRLSRARYTTVNSKYNVPSSCNVGYDNQNSFFHITLPENMEPSSYSSYTDAPEIEFQGATDEPFDPISFFDCSDPFQFSF